VKLFGRSSYIEIYDNTLSKKECDLAISSFENGEKKIGTLGDWKYDFRRKKDLEIRDRFSNHSLVSNIIREGLSSCLEKYATKYGSMSFMSFWEEFDGYNIQKYDGEDDGYFQWHCEHGHGTICANRVLAWMFYLNDAKCGTEFMYYPTVRAKMGRCVVWPAGWTHVHRGVTPNKGVKYIATGWASFTENQ
jgi:hypothetical protein